MAQWGASFMLDGARFLLDVDTAGPFTPIDGSSRVHRVMLFDGGCDLARAEGTRAMLQDEIGGKPYDEALQAIRRFQAAARARAETEIADLRTRVARLEAQVREIAPPCPPKS